MLAPMVLALALLGQAKKFDVEREAGKADVQPRGRVATPSPDARPPDVVATPAPTLPPPPGGEGDLRVLFPPRIQIRMKPPGVKSDDPDSRQNPRVIPPGARVVSAMEILVAISAVLLMIVLCFLATFLRLRSAIDADMMFKMVGLALTVGSAIFLIGAGYAQEQIAPVMGFLGTALGFIFGRNAAPTAPEPVTKP